ncbi:MAG: DUF4160 domain-containing protein [Halobacteriovoraceae bacterium]|jgi:hypothetical protein|nr:DUF4160 domain-containing protein [Halobacteriovoraceae bacterium]
MDKKKLKEELKDLGRELKYTLSQNDLYCVNELDNSIEHQIDSLIYSISYMIRCKYSPRRFYYFYFYSLTLPFTISLNLIKALLCLINQTTFSPCFDIPDDAQMAGSIGRHKIQIYSNDHPPPHFHIKSDGYNLKFSIADCSILTKSGYKRSCLKGSEYKKIKVWHKQNRKKLNAIWDKFHKNK